MEPVANLVGLIVTLCATLASEHDTRGGHPGETGKPDELPAHAHQFRRLVG
jgi:hypothetical protein